MSHDRWLRCWWFTMKRGCMSIDLMTWLRFGVWCNVHYVWLLLYSNWGMSHDRWLRCWWFTMKRGWGTMRRGVTWSVAQVLVVRSPWRGGGVCHMICGSGVGGSITMKRGVGYVTWSVAQVSVVHHEEGVGYFLCVGPLSSLEPPFWGWLGSVWPPLLTSIIDLHYWPPLLTSIIDLHYWPPLLTSIIDLHYWPPLLTSIIDLHYWPPLLTSIIDLHYWPPLLTSIIDLHYWPPLLTSIIDLHYWPPLLTSIIDLHYWPPLLTSIIDLHYWPLALIFVRFRFWPTFSILVFFSHYFCRIVWQWQWQYLFKSVMHS